MNCNSCTGFYKTLLSLWFCDKKKEEEEEADHWTFCILHACMTKGGKSNINSQWTVDWHEMPRIAHKWQKHTRSRQEVCNHCSVNASESVRRPTAVNYSESNHFASLQLLVICSEVSRQGRVICLLIQYCRYCWPFISPYRQKPLKHYGLVG